MGLLIGMDEAGYGPNLGPLVVTVTAWDVPGSPRDADLWQAFADVVTSAPARGDRRLHVADSKQVYKSSGGLGALERGVLAALGLLGHRPSNLQELCGFLCSESFLEMEPWHDGRDVFVPQAADADESEAAGARWQACCRSSGIALAAVRCDVVCTPRFNRLTREAQSKGRALSQISLQLLREVWDPDAAEPALVIADKHGGRNRYDDLLAEILDGRMFFRLEESAELSRYRVGNSEIRFQPRAETHLPVALASMVSKYVRQMAMIRFNDFWRAHVPELKPTQGYAVDARRFRGDIAVAQARLGLDDEVLWRER